MKTCTKCGEAKPDTLEFYRWETRRNHFVSCCKKCENAWHRKYHAENREKEAERQRKYDLAHPGHKAELARKRRALNPEQYRIEKRRNTLYKHGLTLVEYSKMVVAQDGKCAICGCQPKEGRSLSVDHDHKTNKVRALLCQLCNSFIGYAKEDFLIFEKAVEYLRKHSYLSLVKTGS